MSSPKEGVVYSSFCSVLAGVTPPCSVSVLLASCQFYFKLNEVLLTMYNRQLVSSRCTEELLCRLRDSTACSALVDIFFVKGMTRVLPSPSTSHFLS